MDIQNLDGKLCNLIDVVNNTQNVLNKNNLENRDLDDKIRNLDCQCANLKCENNNLNNNILKEKALRGEKEKQNQHLNDVINDHDHQICDLENKNATLNSLNEQVTYDSNTLKDDNDNLKQHIMLLTQQNQKLLCELEKVKEQDMRMKTLLSRKEQSTLLLRGVNSCIEQAKCCLEKIENDPLGCSCNNLRNSGERVRVNSSEHYRSGSPTYHYVRKEEA